MSGEACQGEPKQSWKGVGRVGRELCTELGGKATASGEDSWRGAFSRGAAIAHPQTSRKEDTLSPPPATLPPLASGSHWLNPAGSQRARKSLQVSRARQEGRAEDQEGKWRVSSTMLKFRRKESC